MAKKSKIDIAGIAMKAGGLAVGSIAGKFVANKFLPNLNPVVKNAGLLVIGAALGAMQKKPNILTSVGDGLIATGATGIVGKFVPALAGDEMVAGEDSALGNEVLYERVGLDDLENEMLGDEDNALGDEDSALGDGSDY